MRFSRLLSLLIVCCLGVTAQASQATTRILLIGKNNDHGPGTHEYMFECHLLAKCLKQVKGVETIVSNGWPKDEHDRKDIKAIVLYTANGGDVLLAPEAREQSLALLKSGAGLTAIHWSTGASKLFGDQYLKLLGGWFSTDIGSKLNTTSTPLLQLDPKHPICNGWKSFDLRDEYYLDLKFSSAIKPVLGVKIKNKQYTVGWTYERPKSDGGRSFGFVCGHFHDNFTRNNFRKAVVNGILWTAHRDVPPDGAPVGLVPKDLELPPSE